MATTNAHIGKILQTSPTGEHTIISEDGSHYSFSQSHWQAINPPQVGDAVQFSFDEAGQVIGVMRRDVVAGETSQRMDSAAPDAGLSVSKPSSSMPPPMPKSSNSDQHTAQGHYAPPTVDTLQSHNMVDDSLQVRYMAEADYTIVDWTKKCFNNYANFTNGRARRKEYWFFYLMTFIVSIALSMLGWIFGETIGDLLSGIWSLAVIIPTLAAGSRRLHDIGKSGWWQLLWFLPVIGWIVIIVFLATETQPEPNKWGMPAKPVAEI